MTWAGKRLALCEDERRCADLLTTLRGAYPHVTASSTVTDYPAVLGRAAMDGDPKTLWYAQPFDRHPTLFVFAFRFLYGLRTVSPVAIGTTRLPTARFMALNGTAALVWATMLSLLAAALVSLAIRRSPFYPVLLAIRDAEPFAAAAGTVASASSAATTSSM